MYKVLSSREIIHVMAKSAFLLHFNFQEVARGHTGSELAV